MLLIVQVFGRRHDDPFHVLWRPASKKRQGTKAREVGHRRGNGRYGDLRAARSWRVDVTPRGCGRRICTLARLEACNRHIGKRLERINERTVRGPKWPGREGSLPAWGQRIGTGKLRRSREVWLMMCRSCSASGATSARSRARRINRQKPGSALAMLVFNQLVNRRGDARNPLGSKASLQILDAG